MPSRPEAVQLEPSPIVVGEPGECEPHAFLGTAGALALSRLIAGLLYGVGPRDPLTYAGIALLLAAVAFLACYVPARRAARLDPVAALRRE